MLSMVMLPRNGISFERFGRLWVDLNAKVCVELFL